MTSLDVGVIENGPMPRDLGSVAEGNGLSIVCKILKPHAWDVRRTESKFGQQEKLLDWMVARGGPKGLQIIAYRTDMPGREIM